MMQFPDQQRLPVVGTSAFLEMGFDFPLPRPGVAVTWDLIQVDRQQRNLHLTWIERDGPPVERPLRKGFGSTLLERVLTLQCNATIEFDFEPSGLQFRMDAPLAEGRLVPKY